MATLKDVAAETGLAIGTVSRVLNNRGYISDDTRNKVYDAMKKLNYYPNEVARSLYSKSSNTVGLITPHIRQSYFSEMIGNLESEASRRGYKILLGDSDSTEEKRQEYLSMCYSNQVAGIFLCSGTSWENLFHQADVPIITIGCFMENGTASVECDNVHGGELAAEKLISSGCKHLLSMGISGTGFLSERERSESFRKVCQREHIPMDEIRLKEAGNDELTYQEQIEQALLKTPGIDGIFASNDMLAAQALQICRKLRISIPDQMKVIGFDDVLLSTLTTPQLTTVHQPVKEMAEFAIQMLQDAGAGKMVPKRTVLPVALVEREST